MKNKRKENSPNWVLNLALMWAIVDNLWYNIRHPFCKHHLHISTISREPWKRAFRNVPDWDDEKKKEAYERYSKELASDCWWVYSNYDRRVSPCSQYNLPNTTLL